MSILGDFGDGEPKDFAFWYFFFSYDVSLTDMVFEVLYKQVNRLLGKHHSWKLWEINLDPTLKLTKQSWVVNLAPLNAQI